ncbi:MAG: alpha/beta hydrolase [Amaricoccus sp.]|uniref:alpha/beta hydrolase n=1 Tax=Amaricoccus sp. TaxID=1872485 RepID=UPI0033158EBB
MLLGLLRWIAWAVILLLLVVLGARTYVAVTDDRLAVWHRYAPDEPTAEEIDAMDWAAWMAAEDRAFAEVRENVTLKLTPDEQVPLNRYWEGSPIYSPAFPTDWNRSFVLRPEGEAKGAVALLHGLTDAPYSLRHVAELYRSKGYVAVGIRMPGHGTVPGGLERAEWPQWMAATRLAVREARLLAGTDKPLDIVGYSNGGALAMIYEADALGNPTLPAPDRIVLISPMIGVTFFARFAGIAGWPALLPAFDRAAWFDLIPEYNPFKYNSFPVNAGRQSYLLTEQLRARLDAVIRSGAIARAAPVLTFQSVVDSTVSAPAVVSDLYDRLPVNGSELVLYDVNRAAQMAPMLRPAALSSAARLVPAAARPYRIVVIGNVPGDTAAVERVREAGATEEVATPLGADYPRDIFSLSHVAPPFPPWDGLYGYAPDGRESFGISLGSLSARGETGTLTVSLDQVGRLTSNPFFDAMLARIGRMIDERG